MNWDKLIKIFLEKNSQINLSAIRDADGVLVKHIQDSLELDKVLDLTQTLSSKERASVCDVGTGGGFPLLPLAMTNPDVSFIGIDSIGKKVRAVNDMIKDLELKNVRVVRSRIEQLTTNSEQLKVPSKFDVVTARAVAYIDKLLFWILHLVKKGGHIILYKKFSEEERKDLLGLCKKFSLKLEKEHKYSLFDGDLERVIYIIRKP